MLLLQHTPHPALQSFVVDMYLMHVQLPDGQNPVFCPFPPTPLQFLVFYLDDKVTTQKHGEDQLCTRGRCIIIGPQATRMNLLIGKSHRCFVITFQPGGLYRLLGIPMKELYDDGFEGRELTGPDIESLTNQLLHMQTFVEMITAAESYLLKKKSTLKSILPFDAAIRSLLNTDGALSIEKTASMSCLSLRQFERKCNERIGYSPKFFARLARFSKAYRLREMKQELSWTSIAHHAGYYDQMHFIRDFKQFAGITPTGLDTEILSTPFRMQADLRV